MSTSAKCQRPGSPGKKWRLIVLVLGLIAPLAQGSGVGKVLFSIGQVSAVNPSGKGRALVKGDEIFAGDTIITMQGQVQVRFLDGGFVALQQSSRYRIDEFSYTGVTAQEQKTFFSLLKGALRTITGSVGKRLKKSYRINTAIATIGIRGTVFNAKLCQGDCADKKDGLYVDTVQGTIFVRNDTGELDVPAGNSVYVRDRVTKPVLNYQQSKLLEPQLPSTQPEISRELFQKLEPDIKFDEIEFVPPP